MPKIFIYIFLFFLTPKLKAQIPSGYYQGTASLSKYPLKQNLAALIGKQTISWNYGDLPIFFEQTDRDIYYENDSSVLDIYSENPNGQDPYNYFYQNNNLIAGAANEGEGWNREHIYSQSFFYSNYPMYSDMHFIVPTDARVNQRRSNYPFGTVNSPSFTSLNGTKVGPSNLAAYPFTVTEPINEFKGDVARMLFYTAVRYENLIPWFNYGNIRNPLDSLPEKAFKNWSLDLLLQWHNQDPVSQREIDRNNIIFNIQGNRNPFIDHPEFANAIWSSPDSNTSIPDAPNHIDLVETRAHFAIITWPTVPDIHLLGYEIYLNDEKIGNSKTNFFTIEHLNPNTSYSVKIRSYTNAYSFSPFTTKAFTTTGTDTFSKEIFISKLIVGAGNNKAIEISNLTGHTIDLRNYYFNIRQQNASTGNLYWSSNAIQLEGFLAPNRKFVLLNPLSNLNCIEKDSADILSNATPLKMDGTFAIELSYKNNRIDLIGNPYQIDSFAVEQSLYRKPNIKEPNAVFENLEWDFYPINYCEGLGNPSGNSAIQPKEKESNLFSIYPNPNRESTWTVEGKDINLVKSLKIIGIDGKVILEKKMPFQNGNKKFNISKIHKGWFIILIDQQAIATFVP